MENFDIYKDVAKRTGGDIYIGVVGPVRTGKSTFIKRFMDTLVIPNIENEHTKNRAIDELPQSGNGKTIMTTEPKFVPNEAVNICLNDNLCFNLRMVDCVGYLIPEAYGQEEDDLPRMVSTPWSKEPMPFSEAAEIGTKKVITDHSTIGIVITTDGSITGIDRESYIEAEERVINELKELNKPFVVLLNSTKPYSDDAISLKDSLSEKYNTPVISVNCSTIKANDITNILEKILYEFPIKEIKVNLPNWIETLELSHWLKQELIFSLKSILKSVHKFNHLKDCSDILEENEFIRKAFVDKINLGDGSGSIEINLNDGLFYDILSETTDMPIKNDYQLIHTIKKLSEIKKDYDKIEVALSDVKRRGYGIVSPVFEDIKLDQPEIFKQGSRYGIKLKAKGESIHMIKANIETEVNPIVGTEEQSKDYIAEILAEYETDPSKIWNLNIFGRTLDNLVNEGMQNKIYRMPEDAQDKMQETLQKIINEGSGGLICIIL